MHPDNPPLVSLGSSKLQILRKKLDQASKSSGKNTSKLPTNPLEKNSNKLQSSRKKNEQASKSSEKRRTSFQNINLTNFQEKSTPIT